MGRKKGTGSLQREKNGTWTMRACIMGKRFSRSTDTTDRAKAERYLMRFLAPFGRGERRVPLGEVWNAYLMSPKRNDLAPSTLNAKRLVWHHFAAWMETHHLEVGSLNEVSAEAIAEYLAFMRVGHSATTYNNRVCVLREIFHVLSGRAGFEEDPWEGVRLRTNDVHSRRELTVDEIRRLLEAARKAQTQAPEVGWLVLVQMGLYTGLRLGDCCCLRWSDINLAEDVIQVVPRKTRRHLQGRPVTIPIHSILRKSLLERGARDRAIYVLPVMAEWYLKAKWHVTDGLKRIFAAANITTSVRIEGRANRAPEATFHSLRHTFVSFAANAGVPLPVVQSIVGHCSTAMTRHYYHENMAELRRAVAAVPNILA